MDERVDYNNELREKCCIAGSEVCHWLGDRGCASCYIASLKNDSDREKALDNWKVMLSNLPKDIDELGEQEECALCKGTPKKAEYYVSVDMAHPDPEAKKGIILGFGKKVRIPVGSLCTVHLRACPECRRKAAAADMAFILTLIAFIAAGLIFTAVPPIVTALDSINELLPIGLLAVMVIAGYFVAKLVSNACRKSAEEKVKLNLRGVPQIDKMLANRWFFFQESKGMPKLFFTKKKDFKHIFKPRTAADEEAEQVRAEEPAETVQAADTVPQPKEEIEDQWSKFLD